MVDRATALARAAAGLREFGQRAAGSPVMVGFDGFVDTIIAVVDKRHDVDHYDPIETIEQFGRKILAAAGHSSNYEFVVKLEKLGGNGPIMANALVAMGLPVTYIGSLGLPEPLPVFAELTAAAEEVHTVAAAGLTDAVEFNDGKLMLGKYGGLHDVNWSSLVSHIGEPRITEIVQRSRLIGMTNWTMLSGMSGIWAALIEQVLPKVEPHPAGRRMVFIDLADPEKRTGADLRAAMELVGRFEQHVDTALGLNLKEAVQVAEVLGVPVSDDAEAEIESMARAIQAKLGVSCVVIHPRKSAAAAMRRDGELTSAMMIGTFTNTPKLSTGAGDNFNAGFCLGLLADLPVAEALCAGNAASGFYVRNARSATLSDLAEFCANMPGCE